MNDNRLQGSSPVTLAAIVFLLSSCEGPHQASRATAITMPPSGWIAFVRGDQNYPWESFTLQVAADAIDRPTFDVAEPDTRRRSIDDGLTCTMRGEGASYELTVFERRASAKVASGSAEFGVSTMTLVTPPLVVVEVGSRTIRVVNGSWSTIEIMIESLNAGYANPGGTRDLQVSEGTFKLRLRSRLDPDMLPKLHTRDRAGPTGLEVAERSIRILDAKSGVWCGSGSLMTARRAVTAWHVVDGLESIIAESLDGRRAAGRVLIHDKDHDIAVLEFDEGVGLRGPLEVIDRPLRAKERVWVYARSSQFEFLTLSEAFGAEEINSPAWPGSSGSGVFVEDEGRLKLAGIVTELKQVDGDPSRRNRTDDVTFFRGRVGGMGSTKISGSSSWPVRSLNALSSRW